ncbi:uncharacterized protein L969DRAFT_92465 [Mixia osmundae IAM 14324]|uniref:Uncharacterized protein n=1 Tax=Mixia osmundae (strain CBS 9802 / IAM 14324 / JCM 22182 / KY 12970) TaxID=764103 RepID=G7DXG6_MIXOS|nr:uncharacterized protein L969DRAFT_92465 [Mixia osmundae IAM 14324]KEI41230.1 hypothetical protein L969DRAFT_92465 [Mixia osmundae IAM 14324]GAA95276.1 hypothetical protein E5Q_01932 [Mixia osmundae IAM 14324]
MAKPSTSAVGGGGGGGGSALSAGSGSGSNSSLPSLQMQEPTFFGYVETTLDALLVFEACHRGILAKVPRRLQDKEKELIRSGSIFVFDEKEAGIKRWTDGMIWSPSRILNNFLVYREMDKDKKLPVSSKSAVSGENSAQNIYSREPNPSFTGKLSTNGLGNSPSMPSGMPMTDVPGRARASSDASTDAAILIERARERALVGSLTSSVRFKAQGLVKKTFSIGTLHMVGYYALEDVLHHRLRTPSSLFELAALDISPEFLSASHFRIPPKIEQGLDGVLRYRGEPEELMSPVSSSSGSSGMITPGIDSAISMQASTPISSYSRHPYGMYPDPNGRPQSSSGPPIGSNGMYNRPQMPRAQSSGSARVSQLDRYHPYTISSRMPPPPLDTRREPADYEDAMRMIQNFDASQQQGMPRAVVPSEVPYSQLGGPYGDRPATTGSPYRPMPTSNSGGNLHGSPQSAGSGMHAPPPPPRHAASPVNFAFSPPTPTPPAPSFPNAYQYPNAFTDQDRPSPLGPRQEGHVNEYAQHETYPSVRQYQYDQQPSYRPLPYSAGPRYETGHHPDPQHQHQLTRPVGPPAQSHAASQQAFVSAPESYSHFVRREA